MSTLDLAIAVLVLLITPGPTNTLVLLAGAERGFAKALRLIPAELAGYLLTVLPLALLGATLLDDHVGLRAALTLVAGVWVAVLAVRLWGLPAEAAAGQTVTARSLFVTTALNPKALIFGLVLLPAPERLAANLALFAGLVVLVALGWAGTGAAMRAGGVRQPRAMMLVRRLASVWLATISVVLIARGVAA